MQSFSVFKNLDLLSVGVAVAATAILGFAVFLNNKKSVTNQGFLLFSAVTILWGIVNYLSYQVFPPVISFWFLKITIFLGVWHSFSLFNLLYVFPEQNVVFPIPYKRLLVPITAGVSLLTFTPFVFLDIGELSAEGRIIRVINGPGIVLFASTVLSLIAAGVFLLFKKTRSAAGIQRKQFQSVLIGIIATFLLLMTFNFILPAFFENPRFIPLGPVFILPFILFTSYAIFKHGLLNVKIIAAEILTFVLALVTFAEIIFAEDLSAILFRSSIFVLILSFGILLIRSVRREIEQRERLEALTKRLEEANEELKKLDAAKSEFISIASHQLRAPLTVIRGFVSLVVEGSYGAVSDAIKEALGKVAYSTVQLVKLVSDLLNLSRIEAGKIRYEMANNDFVDIVTKVVEEFRPTAEKKGLRFMFINNAGALAPFTFDGDKIREVAVNLTDNAIKYSQQGEVKITLEKLAEDRVRLSVKDQGLGIKKEDVSRLFTKFVRTEDARLQDPNGMGIGLYFVKRVLDDHGGAVGVESEGLGKGSTFWVELPIQ